MVMEDRQAVGVCFVIGLVVRGLLRRLPLASSPALIFDFDNRETEFDFNNRLFVGAGLKLVEGCGYFTLFRDK
jgi:hypothetical protein